MNEKAGRDNGISSPWETMRRLNLQGPERKEKRTYRARKGLGLDSNALSITWEQRRKTLKNPATFTHTNRLV